MRIHPVPYEGIRTHPVPYHPALPSLALFWGGHCLTLLEPVRVQLTEPWLEPPVRFSFWSRLSAASWQLIAAKPGLCPPIFWAPVIHKHLAVLDHLGSKKQSGLATNAKKQQTTNIHQHRPQIAKTCRQLHTSTSNSTPRRAPQTAPGRQSRRNAPAPSPRTAPRTAPPNSTPKKHPAINLARMRPRRHQHLTAPQAASQSTTRTSTPNCMPACTLPSILQKCARTVTCMYASTRPSISPAPQTAPKQHPKQHLHQHANCTPPSTLPSISQITFPFLLEVRTPIAFSYLVKTHTHTHTPGLAIKHHPAILLSRLERVQSVCE